MHLKEHTKYYIIIYYLYNLSSALYNKILMYQFWIFKNNMFIKVEKFFSSTEFWENFIYYIIKYASNDRHYEILILSLNNFFLYDIKLKYKEIYFFL